jgi:hypothetical protein
LHEIFKIEFIAESFRRKTGINKALSADLVFISDGGWYVI